DGAYRWFTVVDPAAQRPAAWQYRGAGDGCGGSGVSAGLCAGTCAGQDAPAAPDGTLCLGAGLRAGTDDHAGGRGAVVQCAGGGLSAGAAWPAAGAGLAAGRCVSRCGLVVLVVAPAAAVWDGAGGLCGGGGSQLRQPLPLLRL